MAVLVVCPCSRSEALVNRAPGEASVKASGCLDMSAALRRWSNGISAGKRGQRDTGLIRELFNLMPSALRTWKTFVFAVLFAGIAPAVFGQSPYASQGGE